MDSERDSERDLTELHEDIVSTSEDIEADAADLKEIEARKATIAAGDPELVGLSEAAEGLADRIRAKARTETALAKEAARTDEQ